MTFLRAGGLYGGSLGGQRRWLIDQIGGKVSLGLLSQPEPRSLSRVKPVRAA
jgi:hypothetical protein